MVNSKEIFNRKNLNGIESSKISEGGLKREHPNGAQLSVDVRFVKSLKSISVVFAIIAAMSLVIALTLYFRPMMFEWGKSGYFYILWILIFVFCVSFSAVKGAEAICHDKRGGIALSEGVLSGNSGLFCQKAVSLNADKVESFKIKHSRWSGYTLTINGYKFYHYVLPFEFKEVLLKNTKKSNEAEDSDRI